MSEIKEFDRSDLVKRIAAKHGLSNITVESVLDALAKELPNVLNEYGRAEIYGLFVVKTRPVKAKAYKVTDQTGTVHQGESPAYDKIVFKGHKKLCDSLTKLTGKPSK